MAAPLFSLVIPTFNEAKNIRTLISGLAERLRDVPHELIVVDDDSPDMTWKVAEELRLEYPQMMVHRRLGKRGLGSAVLEGFERAQGSCLGVIDGDLSHDDRILPALIEAVQEGAELAVGSRRVAGGGASHWPWHRRLISTGATSLSRRLLSLSLSDPMSGYFVLSRGLWERVRPRLSPRGYKILLEIYCKARPSKVVEIPFVFQDRTQGVSKLTPAVARQYLEMLGVLCLDETMQKVRYLYHTGRYRKVAALLKEGSVLDLGCGQPCETMPDGAFLRFLGRGSGVDMKACVIPFPFYQADVKKLPFADHSFDNIVAMEILEHVPEADVALAEIKRVLKTDGRLVISFPHETALWEVIWHLWERSFGFAWYHTHSGTRPLREWYALLERYLHIDKSRRHWYFDIIIGLRNL